MESAFARVTCVGGWLQELEASDLEEYCADAGVRLGFVPANASLSPEHLHSSDDATFAPFSTDDPLRDGDMDEGLADEMREKLNKLIGEGGGHGGGEGEGEVEGEGQGEKKQ